MKIKSIISFLLITIFVSQANNNLIFPKSWGGLSFPLPSPTNTHHLLVHGPHCFKMEKMYQMKKPTTQVDKMHQKHCKKFLLNIRDYMKNNPMTLPSVLCRDINSLTDFHEGIFCYGVFCYSQNQLKENEIKNPNEYFDFLSGKNFGKILMKEYKKEKLSIPEQKYLEEWKAPRSLRLSWIGISCSAMDLNEI
eukprot:gene11206-4026_t